MTVACFSHVVQRADVRMRERGDGLGFSLEPVAELRVVGDPGGEDLDRDRAIEAGVARPVDLAHPARTERGHDFVRTKARAGSEGQRQRDYRCGNGDRAGILGYLMPEAHEMHPYPRVSVEETLTAAPGIVDVWCYFYGRNDDRALVEAQAALMGQDETIRWSAFKFEDDRRMFLAAHALVRCTLSAYCDVPPAKWRFAVGPHGKPRIQAPTPATPLNFNLAHTRGLVVCAVSVAHELVGVDVECVDGRHTDALAVADRYFSAAEASALRQMPASEQERRFLQQWTLKESYVKANGWGLAAALDRFDSQLDAAPDLWRCTTFDPSPHHIGAVCAKTDGRDLSLRVVESVPLLDAASR